MAESNFQAPMAAGTVWGGPKQDFGYMEFVQFATVAFNATLVSQVILYLPYSPPQYQPRITSITVDVTTAYNSATSAYLTVGKTSGGFDFMGSASLVDVKGGTGRIAYTFTAAQVAALKNPGQAAVYVTVTSVGQPTAGSATVLLHYTVINIGDTPTLTL